MKRETTAGETRTVSKRDSAAHVLLIAGLCLAVYGNTLGNGFVYDDVPVIEDNYAIRNPANLSVLFHRDYFRVFGELSFRPVVTATYFLDYALWRLRPAGYHLTNFLLHTVNGILFYSCCVGS